MDLHLLQVSDQYPFMRGKLGSGVFHPMSGEMQTPMGTSFDYPISPRFAEKVSHTGGTEIHR